MRQLAARLLLLKEDLDNLPLVTARVRMHLMLLGSDRLRVFLVKIVRYVITKNNHILEQCSLLLPHIGLVAIEVRICHLYSVGMSNNCLLNTVLIM
jgi:hypothetical protein